MREGGKSGARQAGSRARELQQKSYKHTEVNGVEEMLSEGPVQL